MSGVMIGGVSRLHM